MRPFTVVSIWCQNTVCFPSTLVLWSFPDTPPHPPQHNLGFNEASYSCSQGRRWKKVAADEIFILSAF